MSENVSQYVGHVIRSAQPASGIFEMLFHATQALRWTLFGLMGLAVTLTFTYWASVNACTSASLETAFQAAVNSIDACSSYGEYVKSKAGSASPCCSSHKERELPLASLSLHTSD
jgi:hypothetical protein